MKILICAYACEPNKGSEPEVGWQMVNEIAKLLPNDTIYVVTKANNKEVIEKEDYPSNIKFIYYELPKWLTFWKKGGRGIRTYYYLWMIGASLYMKRQNINFDIVHHITFVNDWLPSFFSLLKNKNNKFIWGPIGSNDPIENKFLDGNRQKIIEKIRITLQIFFRNFDPMFYFCKNKADCIIGINNNVKNKLSLDDKISFIVEPAIGIKKDILRNINKKVSNDNVFRIISVGRLIYIKNFKLTILSFATFLKNNPQIKNIKLQIVGDGEDRRSLETLVEELGLQNYVEFIGEVSLSKVQDYFSNADIFLFPTLENAGFVILEAMSNYLPVVAMDYGGPQQFVRHNTKEQLVSSKQSYNDIVISLAKNIEKLYFDKTLREKIGQQNHQDVLKNYTWETKARRIVTLYKELLDEA